MISATAISRRSFLKTSGAASAVAVLGGLPCSPLLAGPTASGPPDWVDRPTESPFLTSTTFGAHRPVRITITVEPDQTVSVAEGASLASC